MRTHSKGMKIYLNIMLLIYGIAVLTCFICNFALNRELSWSLIVLVSIAMSFSITNLPFYFKEHGFYIASVAVTAFLYLLLYVCSIVTGGNWCIKAFQIAVFPTIIAWLILMVIKIHRVNWLFKSAFISLLAGVLIIVTNPWVEAVLAGETEQFMNYFNTQYFLKGINGIGNAIAPACFFLYFLIGTLLGILQRKKAEG